MIPVIDRPPDRRRQARFLESPGAHVQPHMRPGRTPSLRGHEEQRP